MKVMFTEYDLIYKGQDRINPELMIIDKKPTGTYCGEVVDTVVMNVPDGMGGKQDVPHFVISLEDGTFKVVPVSECMRYKENPET